MTKKIGWYNRNRTGNTVKQESHRHSLASKGIKTALPKGVKGLRITATITPNFDMVKKDKYDMCLADYHTILGRLGFRGEDRKVVGDKIQVNLSGKWHSVEKGTIKELGKLHTAINNIESKLGLTAPKGRETIVSFGDAKVTEKGLKEVEKLPFIKQGFAKKNSGKSVNTTFRNILDKMPYGKNLTRKNAIMYADMVIAKEGLRKLKAWEIKEMKALGFNMETPEYYSGIHKNVGITPSQTKIKELNAKKIKLQNQINNTLYAEKKDKTDREVLSIIVLGSKTKHFDFLKGKTRWKAIGDWKGYPNEKNVVMEIQFKDSKNETYGKKMMRLLNEYNEVVVGEKLLYARTEPIEESTL